MEPHARSVGTSFDEQGGCLAMSGFHGEVQRSVSFVQSCFSETCLPNIKSSTDAITSIKAGLWTAFRRMKQERDESRGTCRSRAMPVANENFQLCFDRQNVSSRCIELTKDAGLLYLGH
jgi:hypothetical protein